MAGNNVANILVTVIGIVLLVGSLLADAVGIGNDPGFGIQQGVVAIAGIVILAIGLVFTLRGK